MNEDLHNKVMDGRMIPGEIKKAVKFVPTWIGVKESCRANRKASRKFELLLRA